MTVETESWEHKTINKMFEMSVKEQRASRRWSVFFKLAFLGYVLIITAVLLFSTDGAIGSMGGKTFTAVVNIDGEIGAGKDASADNIIPLLRKAFENSSAKAVVMRINSPGGSPVQSKQIYTEMLRLRKKYPDKKLYAVIEDLGASAAYLLACGADQIYSDEGSIVGSIGVLMSSFGFVDTMHKMGVQRRLYYSGSNKTILDPFSPQKPEHVVIIQKELDLMHKLFIDIVKTSRGTRLKIDNDTFSGRFWLGLQAKDLGLIDAFGDVYFVAREVVEAEELVEYEPKKSIFSKLGNKFGQSLRSAITSYELN